MISTSRDRLPAAHVEVGQPCSFSALFNLLCVGFPCWPIPRVSPPCPHASNIAAGISGSSSLAGFVGLNEQFEMQARAWASNESVMTFGAGCVWVMWLSNAPAGWWRGGGGFSMT